jgi:hypothetical protein
MKSIRLQFAYPLWRSFEAKKRIDSYRKIYRTALLQSIGFLFAGARFISQSDNKNRALLLDYTEASEESLYVSPCVHLFRQRVS